MTKLGKTEQPIRVSRRRDDSRVVCRRLVAGQVACLVGPTLSYSSILQVASGLASPQPPEVVAVSRTAAMNNPGTGRSRGGCMDGRYRR